MKLLLTFILSATFTVLAAQESIFVKIAREDSLKFQEFLHCFEKKEIPTSLYNKFFRKNFNEHVSGITPWSILCKSKNITLIVEVHCSAGGYCSSLIIGSFKPNGELIREISLGSNSIDLMGGYKCEIKEMGDNLIEAAIFRTQLIESIDQYKVNGDINYVHCFYDENGFKIINPTYSKGRAFAICSRRVLSVQELETYNIEQLDIMRNEIFADHSYKFKNKKWQIYFKSKNWYIPKYDNVNDLLNEIEKVNLSRILKMKNKKTIPTGPNKS